MGVQAIVCYAIVVVPVSSRRYRKPWRYWKLVGYRCRETRRVPGSHCATGSRSGSFLRYIALVTVAGGPGAFMGTNALQEDAVQAVLRLRYIAQVTVAGEPGALQGASALMEAAVEAVCDTLPWLPMPVRWGSAGQSLPSWPFRAAITGSWWLTTPWFPRLMR